MKNLIRLAALLLVVLGVGNCFAMANVERDVLSGKPAPAFSLMDLNEKEVSSTDFFGKQPVVLFFWATWCPHCRTAIKQLNEISSSLKSKGAEIITVDLGERKSLVKSYMKEHNYNLIVLLDEAEALVEPYGVVGVPTFFLIDRYGKVSLKTYSLPEDYETILFKDKI
ncbi:MAG: TlpA disulfide reductase family protein [Candidatus Omnitrophota bacterium]|nr:TlpA disulfide reductase family protein [Candidatus Omnitrophota bacterium]